MRALRMTLAGAVLAMIALPLAAQTTIGSFTGGNPGEGLDMKGLFPYAVNVGGPGGNVVGDATFTTTSAPGVTFFAQNTDASWASPSYGSTPSDDNLEAVMQSIQWSDAPTPVQITLATTAGVTYKLQMMFTESCCNRAFDVSVNGNLIADDFSPQNYSGINSNPTAGGVITHTFVATGSSTSIVLDGSNVSGTFTDHNPTISAFTLEQVEPIPTLGEWALILMSVALALVGVVAIRRV